MLQIRRDLDLAQEPFDAEYRTEFRLEHLDGDGAIVLDVVREKHRGHAAGADLAVEAVATAKCGGETIEHVGHRPTFRMSSSNQFTTTTTSFFAPAAAPDFTK